MILSIPLTAMIIKTVSVHSSLNTTATGLKSNFGRKKTEKHKSAIKRKKAEMISSRPPISTSPREKQRLFHRGVILKIMKYEIQMANTKELSIVGLRKRKNTI